MNALTDLCNKLIFGTKRELNSTFLDQMTFKDKKEVEMHLSCLRGLERSQLFSGKPKDFTGPLSHEGVQSPLSPLGIWASWARRCR